MSAVTMARTWATYVACRTCRAGEGQPCKKASTGESYRGLYMHRDRVSRAVGAALEVECPKCGREAAVPCFFRAEVLTSAPGASIVAVGSKLKVHDERARAARNARREAVLVSIKRDAEAVLGAVRNSDWAAISGGQMAVSSPFTLLRPGTDSKGTATYAIHQPSGRLFRSVTRGSNALTSCAGPRATVHSKWLSDIASQVPGGDLMLAREPGRSTTPSGVGNVPAPEPEIETPEPEPEQEPEPVYSKQEILMSTPSFLTPTTKTKRMIVEEVEHSLELSVHDLTRLLTAAGVKVSPKRVKIIDQEDRDVTGTLRIEWTETTEREENV